MKANCFVSLMVAMTLMGCVRTQSNEVRNKSEVQAILLGVMMVGER